MGNDVGALGHVVPMNKAYMASKYLPSMANVLPDKKFFLTYLPDDVTVLADFGCADGILMQSVGSRFDHLIGYDHDADMLGAARKASVYDVELTDSYPMLAARLDRHHRSGRKSVLVLSSVIHEVISQGVPWGTLWQAVCDLGCHYVAIRDMAVTSETYGMEAPGPLPFEDEELRGALLRSGRHGRAGFLQALLKARYPDNLAREAKEDYFPVPVETMLNTATIGSGYKLRYFEHSSLPFLVEEWKRDYGLTIKDPTHVKMLLKRTRP